MVRIRRLLPLLLALLLALGARGEAEALPPPLPVNEGLRAIRVTQLVLGAAELGEYEPAHPRADGDGGAASGRGVDVVPNDTGIDIQAAGGAFNDAYAKWSGFLTRSADQADAFGLPGTPGFVIGSAIHRGALSERS